MGVLMGANSDIHRVLWVNAKPVDVKNDSQQGTHPQAICSSNFLMWILGVISILFEKTGPVNMAENECKGSILALKQ